MSLLFYICVSIHAPFIFFFFNDTATTEIYTLSLHDALPISFRIEQRRGGARASAWIDAAGHIVRATSAGDGGFAMERSAFEIAYENFRRSRRPRRDRESTPLDSSHDQISYALFCF